MKQRRITFTAENVVKLLQGKKTQTRRVINPDNNMNSNPWVWVVQFHTLDKGD